jgi:hypothetical protein
MTSGNEGERDRAAAEYWTNLAAGAPGNHGQAGALEPRGQRRQKRTQALATIEDDTGGSTDALALIVEAIRENSDAIKAATAEMTATRLAMGDSEQRHEKRGSILERDNTALIKAVNRLTASDDAIQSAKAERYVWAIAGALAAAMLVTAGFLDGPGLWHYVFG